MRRVACPLLVALSPLFFASIAFAQQPGPQPLAHAIEHFDFLNRYDYQLEANVLSGDNGRQYRWDAHYGGAVDVLDYPKGRVTFVGDYEVVMGSELRPFDPNQSYYILEPAASWFIGNNEVSFVFHHVSRHLSDRTKTFAVAYNLLEGRYLRKFDFGNDASVSVRAAGGHVAQHAQVDYTWGIDWDVMARRRMNPHIEWYARSTGEMFGVDPLVRDAGRGVQHTTRLELGSRVTGTKADLELFVGAEHRLDASPVDFVPVSWAIAGFRIVSK
ncbi:MAG TPA: hypothetical protein VFP91_09845 [Vicinamibacterales bacterium]|nr:hypothetical protein [Vicinamibacterales bacterium]